MRIYLRRVFNHDVTHEVSVRSDIVSEFFDNASKSIPFYRKDDHTTQYAVDINSATDPRFGGKFKDLLRSYGDVNVNDIILIRKYDNYYDLEIIRPSDSRYETYYGLFSNGRTSDGRDRHQILNVDESVQEDVNDNSDEMNIYQKAAKYLSDYAELNNIAITERADIEKTREDFIERFGPEKLAALNDNDLLEKVFYTQGSDNTDSLCCWIEMNKECRSHFGSISGGSAYKFGLFQRQDDGRWQAGSAAKPIDLSYDEALVRGKAIRDALITGCEIIDKAVLNTVEDYEQLDDLLKSSLSSEGVYYDLAWFHKYFSILYPNKLSSYHNNEWQNHILRCLNIAPSEKYYGRSGQIALVQNYGRWMYKQFFDIMYSRFGGIKRFLRIGSSDENKSYATEWKKKSIVCIGWSSIGSLEEYKDENGSLIKDSITERLIETYFHNDSRTASRKAGELIRFYESNNDSVFVVMDGERLIGFVDNIGNYSFDDMLNMSHIKSGKWKTPFSDEDRLPNKTEGLRTSCVQLKDGDNLLYLYNKYYYGKEYIEEKNIVKESKLENCLQVERNVRTNTIHPMNLIIYGAPGT